MATKNNRRVLLTKRILKESLLELMQEKPISKITIKDICDLSEMSRSTFYLHYQDQFELLKDIENEVLEQTFKSLENIGNDFNTIESIDNFLEYVKSNKETFGVLLCQPDTEDFQNSILKAIAEHVQSSIPETYTDENDKYLFAFVMHGSINILRTWIKNDFDLETSKLAYLIYHSCHNATTWRQ